MIISLFSCDRDEDPAKDVGQFEKISANGSMDIRLVSGVENKVLTTSLSENAYSASNGTLNINGNGNMTIAINEMESFYCNACDLECLETLILDSTDISIHAGSAEFNNLVVTSFVELTFVNSGSYKFKGSALKADLNISNNPRFEGYGFVCDTLIMLSGYYNSEVHAKKYLDVTMIGGAPIVTYKGNPDSVTTSIVGSGKVEPF